MTILLYIATALVSTAVVWWASSLLEVNAARLATHYRLPALVQGALVTAVGSSFPELSSTVIATLVHGEFALGVAGIVGSAIFNILVIPGLSGVLGGRLESSRILVYKDAQFYVTSVAVLLLAFSFAVIYNPVEGERWTGEMTRLIALLPLGLYALYLFLQQQDTAEYQHDQALSASPDATEDYETPIAKTWGLLAFSLLVITVGVEGLVVSAIGLGDTLGTPSFLWGLTVIAAGTSLPDLLVSVRAARAGDSTVSLANAIGSNIFDLLVAIPAGVLIAGAATIRFDTAMPLMGMLTLATIVLFAMLRTGLSLSRRESAVLLAMYGLFLLWVGLETAGITQWTAG